MLSFVFYSLFVVNKNSRAPTLRKSQRICDSVIGSVEVGHTEYVVYEKSQCYPELLLEIKEI